MNVAAKLKQISEAIYVERKPTRRVFLTFAHAIVKARRHNNLHDQCPNLILSSYEDRNLAKWLLYHATPDDLRALADALAYDGKDPWRLNVLKAYVVALKKSDSGCRNIVEPATFIATTSPITWRPMIKFPPSIPEVKAEFVRLFGERCLPENWRWKMKDLIENTWKLPLRVDKKSRARISRLHNKKRKRAASKFARATRQ
jgi:hypothetical protein